MAVDNLRKAAISIATATVGDNSIVAAVAAQGTGSGAYTPPLRIHGIQFTVGGATNLTFKDGASTSLSGAEVYTGNGSSKVLQINEEPYYYCQPGNAFIINSSAAVSIMGTVYYRQG